MAVLASPLALGSAAAAPTAIQLTPHGTATANTGSCQAYSVAAQDGTNPASGETVTLTVTETPTATPAANPISLYDGTCTTATTTGVTTGGSGAGPYTATETLTLDTNGKATFGVSSSAAGTGTVQVSSSATISDQANVTWSAGGADAVTSVTPSPTTSTGYAGSTASFTVTATDTNNNPVQGVTVNEETNTAASPDQISPTACGTTGSAGTVTCTVKNGGSAGTDSLVFWVNNDNGTTHTNYPDPGEPQGTATAVFTSAPQVDAGKSSVTCVQKLSGASQGNAAAICTVPTSQNSVTFTATVEDSNGNAVSGASVNFAATAAKLGGATVTGSNLPSGTQTTGSNGQATFSVTDTTPANGDDVTVSATVAGTAIGSATASWATPKATAVSVVPQLQSVQNGGTVTVKAQVVDQFGTAVTNNPVLTYIVTGRNLGKSGTVGSDGTISYTDADTNPSSKSDTITVTDVADALTGTATVSYVTSTTASAVTVDTSGKGISDSSCGATGNSAATGVALGATTEVCAIVKNSSGEPLAGKAVTFTVSTGQVAAHGALSSSSTTSYAATTDAAGVALADVTSTKSGAQTVTATSDSANGTGTVTYVSATPADAYSIAVTPATGTITAAGSQKFVATVTDKNGNPVAGVTVTYNQTGAGTVGNGNNTAVTGSDGTISVTVTTASTDSGAGTLTFTIPSASTQCGATGGTCTATASYTVAQAAAPTLALTAAKGTKGHNETVHAVVANADGTPDVGATVWFYVTGANSSSHSAKTGHLGHASYTYLASHAGKDTIAAYVDINNDQIREANEPKQTITTYIVAVEKPAIALTTKAKTAKHGKVTIHVVTHPSVHSALVSFYVKRHGVWHKIGATSTGPAGHASSTFTEKKGSHLTFRAKVAATKTSKAGTTASKSITVA